MPRTGFVAIAASVIAIAACSVGESEEPVATTTTQPSGVLTPVVLAPVDLQAVAIGDDAATVVTELTSRFGEPSVDTGWGPSNSPVYGSCPGDELRAVGWGSFFGLFVREAGDETERLFTWTYGYIHDEGTAGVDPRGLDLMTAEGMTLGLTRETVRAIFEDRLTEYGDAELDLWFFTVDGDEESHLRGSFTGETDDAVVQLIEKVPACGNLTALTTDDG